MADCPTVADMLAGFPELGNVGPQSTGYVDVLALPVAGDTITIRDDSGALPVIEVYTAGTDFVIGATVDETATNLAGALGASALVSAVSDGARVHLASQGTGAASMHALSTSNTLAFFLSGPTLTGGDAAMQAALDCACKQLAPKCWGDKLECGAMLLAAHIMAQAGNGASRPIKSQTIDKLKVEYAITAGGDTYDQTTYGQRFKELQSTLVVFPVVGRFTPVVL